MKILYLFEKMLNYGGMERILTSKMNFLSDNTLNEVFFMTYEQAGSFFPFPLSPHLHYVPIEAHIASRESMSFLQWLFAYRRTRRVFRVKLLDVLKQISPDIVVCTTYSFNVLDIIIDLSCKYKLKIIIESHVEASTILMSYKYKYNRFLYPFLLIWDKYILRSLKYGNRLVALTKADAIYWGKYVPHIDVIPNMITINPSPVIDYASKRVISVGRYAYEKGFDRLIEAWGKVHVKFPDWELYIFGSGDRSEYESLVAYYNLEDSVRCMPATDDIASEYSKSSIYVMSSRYEGFGLVLTEAMSCGLPCISFDCPNGPSEIIHEGKNGFLVARDDVCALAKSMEALMSDYTLRKQLGKVAEKESKTYYCVQNIMKMWIDLFEKI